MIEWLINILEGNTKIKGHIRRTNLEGGFEYIERDNGEKYDIIYEKELPVDAYVEAEGKIRKNAVSFRMFGKTLEIKKLKIIDLPR